MHTHVHGEGSISVIDIILSKQHTITKRGERDKVEYKGGKGRGEGEGVVEKERDRERERERERERASKDSPYT